MKKIKTALCSFGMSGNIFHAPFISNHPGFVLYAVLERTKDLASASYPDIITYRTLEDLLKDELIDLVIVNTPNSMHFDHAKKCLEAGKHVIVEKPFTVNSREASELIALSVQKNKKLSVYHNRRWDSDFKTVQQVVSDRLLGGIKEVEIHFDRYKTGLSAKLHKEEPVPGSGILYDLGSHLIDQAIQLFGFPVKIFADSCVMREISKVDDYFELLLFYNELRVRLKASYIARETIPAFVLHGLKGSFIKPRADVQEADLIAGIQPIVVNWGIEPEAMKGLLHTEIEGKIIRENIPSLKGNYMEYFDGIYNAIINNGPLPVTANEGRKVILVIEAAMKSVAEKKIIDFL